MRAAAARATLRLLTIVGGTLAALLLAMLPVAAAVAQPVPDRQFFGADAPGVGGVDIDAVVEDLQDAAVVLVGTSGQAAVDFQPAVDNADDANIALRVVVLGSEPTGATVGDVAEAVLGRVRGTVLVLSPTAVGLASDSAGHTSIDTAVRAAEAFPDRTQAANAAVQSLAGEPFPWSLVAFGAIAVLVIGGVIGGVWERRRRRHERGEHIAELAAGLIAELERLRAGFADLVRRAAPTGRRDLSDRAEAGMADCDQLTDALDEPTRHDIDHAGGELAELRQAHDALDHDVAAAAAADRAVTPVPRTGSQPRS